MSTFPRVHDQDFETYFKQISALARDLASPYVAGDSTQTLDPVRNYSIDRQGKGIRESLVVMTAELFSQDPTDLGPFIHGVGVLHNGALDIDDIQDNSELRRGKLASYRVHGVDATTLNSISLIGEFVSFTAMLREHFEPRNISLLLGFCGQKIMDLAEGQNRDLDASDAKQCVLEDIELTTSLKTGSALAISIVGTAIILGRSKKEIEILTSYCDHLANAFQARDDALDANGSQAETGKTIGIDAKNGRTTFVDIFGGNVDLLHEYMVAQSRIASGHITEIPGHYERFAQLADYVINRTK